LDETFNGSLDQEIARLKASGNKAVLTEDEKDSVTEYEAENKELRKKKKDIEE
jgi:hypothetical protein